MTKESMPNREDLNNDPQDFVTKNKVTVPIGKVVGPKLVQKVPNVQEDPNLQEVPNVDEASSPQFSLDDTSIVDDYHSKLNQLRLSFETVSQLLSVGYCVFDR